MENLLNDNVLVRFLNKETTEGENAEILHWVSQSEENKAAFRRVHDLWHLGKLKQLSSEIDMDEAWNNVQGKMPVRPAKTAFFSIGLWRRVAASAVILLAVGFGSIWLDKQFFEEEKTALLQVEVPPGEKSKLVLADGTRVWLNSETTLQYDALHPREVSLEGEAYFEVEKDAGHPFEVTTASGMKVTVLGTKFNLKCFPGEAEIETTLEEGQVEITGSFRRQSLLLEPGQQAVYNVENNKMVVRNVSVGLYSIWRNNELRFEDISFSELVVRIERWYGVEIKLDTKLNDNDRFTMTVKTESLRELLEMMKLTSNFKYEINGKKVTISAR